MCTIKQIKPAGISSSHPVVDNLIALMGIGEAIIIVALVRHGPENGVMGNDGQHTTFIGENAKLKEVETWKRFRGYIGSSNMKSLRLACQALSFH